jgi:hypothetical protein
LPTRLTMHVMVLVLGGLSPLDREDGRTLSFYNLWKTVFTILVSARN